MLRFAPWVFVVLSLAAFSAAWAQDQEPGMGELPPPSPDLPIFVGKPAPHPLEAVAGQAVAARVLFEGPGPDNTRITIREMLIGPGAEASLDPLPGPALIDPRSGAGTLRTSEGSQQLEIAAPVSVAQGASIQFINDGGDPLLLRLYVVETR